MLSNFGPYKFFRLAGINHLAWVFFAVIVINRNKEYLTVLSRIGSGKCNRGIISGPSVVSYGTKLH